MTTTTPESRGRIAYTAYLRAMHLPEPIPQSAPTFDALPQAGREAWVNAARVVWELATTGRASL